MLLNHIKSKDLFSNYSEEKGESGFGSENSQLQNSENDNYSQDFLSEQYPSQSMRMYQKYMCEPPLYKTSNHIELSNKAAAPVSNLLEYNRMKLKNQDDRPLINTIVNVMKESSTETKETLKEIFENISSFLSKNENLNQSTLKQFNQELKEFHQSMLQAIEQNKDQSEDILKKNKEIQQLNQEVKYLQHQAGSEEAWFNKISEEFSGHKGWLNDNLQKLIKVLKQEPENKRSFATEIETINDQRREFSQLKIFLIKNFKDLEKRILSSTDEVLSHSASTWLDFSKNLSLRFEQILKNCSRNFEENIEKQFENNQHYQEKNTENIVCQNVKNGYHDLQEKINSMCEIQDMSFQKIFNELYRMKQKMDILSQNIKSENQKLVALDNRSPLPSCEKDFNINPYNAINKKDISNDNRFFDVQSTNVNGDNSLNVVPYNSVQLRRSRRLMSNNYNTQAQTTNLSQEIDLKNSQFEMAKKIQECSDTNLKNNFQTVQDSNTSYQSHVWNFGKHSEIINRLNNKNTENEYFFPPEYNFKNKISKKRRFNYLINEENTTSFEELALSESQVSSPAISLMELNIPCTTYHDQMTYDTSIFHFNTDFRLKVSEIFKYIFLLNQKPET